LFLDEIGELPLTVQGKLLRLLQDRSFVQVGGQKPYPADVRFVCATHRNLAQLVAEGKFRADLYYRLHVVEILVPPLRERGPADIDRIAEHFLFTFGRRHGRSLKLSPEARRRLHEWHWPGNVRELEHCLESAVVLAPGAVIHANQLELQPSTGRLHTPEARGPESRGVPTEEEQGPLPSFSSPVVPLEELELAYIRHVLAACGGNRSAASRLLGIGRNTLLRKLEGG
jgi:Nif-specific regulatory protein